MFLSLFDFYHFSNSYLTFWTIKRPYEAALLSSIFHTKDFSWFFKRRRITTLSILLCSQRRRSAAIIRPLLMPSWRTGFSLSLISDIFIVGVEKDFYRSKSCSNCRFELAVPSRGYVRWLNHIGITTNWGTPWHHCLKSQRSERRRWIHIKLLNCEVEDFLLRLWKPVAFTTMARLGSNHKVPTSWPS